MHSIELFRGGGGTEATKRGVGQFLSNGTHYGYKTYSSAIYITLSAHKAKTKYGSTTTGSGSFEQTNFCGGDLFVVPRLSSFPGFCRSQAFVLLERN